MWHSHPLPITVPSGHGRRRAPPPQTEFCSLPGQSLSLAQITQGSSSVNSQLPSTPNLPQRHGSNTVQPQSSSHVVPLHSSL
jgi:hypothetical protein